jgi:HEAT repeat protein
LDRNKIEGIVYLQGSELDTFLIFCQRMHFLSCTVDGKFQFNHLKLRNYCAVPKMIEGLENYYLRDGYINALVQIGSIAVPALLNALRHKDRDVSSAAVIALKMIGSPAIPSLLKALHHEDATVRRLAIKALTSYENANAALPELLSALHDKDSEIRSLAIFALCESKNEAAVAGLIEVLDTELSYLASIALKSIGTHEALQAVEKKASKI